MGKLMKLMLWIALMITVAASIRTGLFLIEAIGYFRVNPFSASIAFNTIFVFTSAFVFWIMQITPVAKAFASEK